MHRLFVRIMLLLIVAAALFAPRASAAQKSQRCFNVPNISYCINHRFREYWEGNGGLAVFGYPLTAEVTEFNRDTNRSHLTQWFERNRFELHSENPRPYDVLLGRLGDDRLRQLGRNWEAELRAHGPVAGCQWFAETRHNVCDQGNRLGFKTYYQTHGLEFDGRAGVSAAESLALFGLPLTEPRIETNANGDNVLTQWFERARFEWHPGNPDQFKVLLGLLGNEIRSTRPMPEGCATPVLDELRIHYEQALGEFKGMLGCPLGVQRGVPVAEQAFERGVMVWVASTRSKVPVGDIYVIRTHVQPVSYQATIDTWVEGEPETGGLNPPAGRLEPKRGFGKVWREQPGVREALGWAIGPERGDTATLHYFENGVMVWLEGRDFVYTFIHNSSAVTATNRYPLGR